MEGECDYIDVCNPVPAETPKPTPYPTPYPTANPTAHPVTSAPIRCEDFLFFLSGGKCTNEVYVDGEANFSEYLNVKL